LVLPLKGRKSYDFSPFKGEIERGMGHKWDIGSLFNG